MVIEGLDCINEWHNINKMIIKNRHQNIEKFEIILCYTEIDFYNLKHLIENLNDCLFLKYLCMNLIQAKISSNDLHYLL